MNETDEALYSRYLETDDDGDLEILLARHREGLLLFLLGFVRNPEDAEDLLMDTFVAGLSGEMRELGGIRGGTAADGRAVFLRGPVLSGWVRKLSS